MNTILSELHELLAKDPLEDAIDRYQEQQAAANRLIDDSLDEGVASTESLYLVKRLSDLLAQIACLEYACKRKCVDASRLILEQHFAPDLADLTGQEGDKTLQELELELERQASLLVARLLLRAKLSLMEATRPHWAELYKLLELYEHKCQHFDLFETEICERSDAIDSTSELQVQMELLDELTSDSSSLLDRIDRLINEAFGLLGASKTDAKQPDGLAKPTTLDAWTKVYVDEKLLQLIEFNAGKTLEELKKCSNFPKQSLTKLSYDDLAQLRQAFLASSGLTKTHKLP